MQKKLLSILTFSRDNTDKSRPLLEALKPYSDRIEVICHLDCESAPFELTNLSFSDYARFIKVSAQLAKGKFIVLVPPETRLNAEAFEKLLGMIENAEDSIIHFMRSDLALCSAIDAKLFKNICKSSAEVQYTDIPLHCFVAAKSVKKVTIVPFVTGNEIQNVLASDRWDDYVASLIIAVRTFNSPRKRISSLMYKSAFDAIYASVSAAYSAAIRKTVADKNFAAKAAEFDDALKAADAKMYEYAERHYKQAPLKKIRADRFTKIPIMTALKFKFTP